MGSGKTWTSAADLPAALVDSEEVSHFIRHDVFQQRAGGIGQQRGSFLGVTASFATLHPQFRMRGIERGLKGS